MKKGLFYILILTIIFSFFFLMCRPDPQHMPEEWKTQTAVLITLTAFLAMWFLMPFRSSPSTIAGITIVQFLFLFIVGFPEGESLTLEILLFILIQSEVCFFTDGPLMFILLFLYNLIITITQLPFDVWLGRISPPALSHRIIFFFINMIILSALMNYKKLCMNYEREHEDNANYKNKIHNFTSSGILQYRPEKRESVLFEEEKKRFIHEIHDSVSYSLVNIIALMDAISVLDSSRKEQKEAMAAKAREQAQMSLRELRIILRSMRLQSMGMNYDLSVLQKMINRFEKSTGIEIKVSLGNISYYQDSGHINVLYHFIQEGLTNAFKHGKADLVEIYMWKDEREFRAIVSDNGTGCIRVEKGLGFYGMEERMKKYKGLFTFRNKGNGFEIEMIIPV